MASGLGEAVDPRYRFKDSTIRDWLDITSQELDLLPPGGQLGSGSLSLRQAARGRRSGESRRVDSPDQDRKIARLRTAEGLSLREIGDRVGMSHQGVAKVLANLDIRS